MHEASGSRVDWANIKVRYEEIIYTSGYDERMLLKNCRENGRHISLTLSDVLFDEKGEDKVGPRFRPTRTGTRIRLDFIYMNW